MFLLLNATGQDTFLILYLTGQDTFLILYQTEEKLKVKTKIYFVPQINILARDIMAFRGSVSVKCL